MIKLSDLEITDIAYDSRKVKEGSLFVAIRGLKSDGHDFIGEAIGRGARVVVCEKPVILNEVKNLPRVPGRSFADAQDDIPFIIVPNSRIALAQISSQFFKEPTRDLTVIGVTGTNGKTTITYLLEAFLKAAACSPAVLGTINYRHEQKIYPATHTTPESHDLQKFIHQVKEEGCDALVMEVSSHALDLHRVDAIHFDHCIFTNLTPEHLDYHQNLENYFKVKCRLFEELLLQSCKKNKKAILNLDDPFVTQLALKFSKKNQLTFSLDAKKTADVFPLSYSLSLKGIQAEVQTSQGKLKVQSPLLGAFNLSNLLAAIAVAAEMGISLSVLEEAIQNFKSVPGRLERVENSKGLHVFVDYAHTPDALKNVLSTLRTLLSQQHFPSPLMGEGQGEGDSGCKRKLITVFGCGGDRDKSKRPLMGEEVAKPSDFVVVTSDNPRTEDPQKIIHEILPGLLSQGWKEGKNFVVQIDRRKAIHQALAQAQQGDIVLIAGKGHEDYQILGNTKTHFDDREVARELLK